MTQKTQQLVRLVFFDTSFLDKYHELRRYRPFLGRQQFLRPNVFSLIRTYNHFVISFFSISIFGMDRNSLDRIEIHHYDDPFKMIPSYREFSCQMFVIFLIFRRSPASTPVLYKIKIRYLTNSLEL